MIALYAVRHADLLAGLDAGRLDPGPAALAQAGPAPAADLLSGGGGWLDRLTELSGAPLAVDTFVLAPPKVAGRLVADDSVREVDAFALVSVYGILLWDDRVFGWHAQSGRADSADLFRRIHDVAMRVYTAYDEGERLVLARVPG